MDASDGSQGPMPEPVGNSTQTVSDQGGAPDGGPVVHSTWVTPELVAPAMPMPAAHELAQPLREMGQVLREMLAVQKEQLELARRAEQRYAEQQQNQQVEWQKWLEEYRHLRGRCKGAEETLRAALVTLITGMVDHIHDTGESIRESDFAQRELTDRYGSSVYQLWNLCGILKRLSAVDQPAPRNEKK